MKLFLLLSIAGAVLSVPSWYNRFCSLCVINNNQYCSSNSTCIYTNQTCQQGGGKITLDECQENIAADGGDICNKFFIITSLNIKKPKLIEFNLDGGEWC